MSGPLKPIDLGALLRKGVRAHNAGDFRQAEANYRQVLATDRNNVEALYLLGVLALQAGFPGQAAELFQSALQRDKRNPDIHFNLGIASINLGRLKEANKALKTAVKLNPLHSDALANLGMLFVESGRSDEGIAYLRRAADIDPGEASFRLNLAIALLKLHRLDDAERELRKIGGPASQREEVKMIFGQVRERQGRRKEAADYFREVLSVNPDHPDAHFSLGKHFLDLGFLDEAERHTRRALDLGPEFTERRVNLGLILEATNREDQAVECFRSAGETGLVYLAEMYFSRGAFDNVREIIDELRALNPNHPCIYSLTSQIGDVPFADGDMQRAEAIAQMEKGDLSDIVDLHLALGRSYEAEGEFAAAFDHFSRANELMCTSQAYNAEEEERWVESMIEVFTPALFEQLSAIGSDSKVPVFVVGMPRSGTSLVDQIIASHPLAASAGEMRDMTQIQDGLSDILGADQPFPVCIKEMDRTSGQQLSRSYIDRLTAVAPAAARIVDKMPGNFRCVGLIALLLPQARIIHCTRNPLDTCLSIFQQRFTGYHPYAYSLARLGHHYRLYERLMIIGKASCQRRCTRFDTKH